MAIARPDHHVVTGLQFFQERMDIVGVVLAVSVHEHQHVARSRACAGFDGGTVSQRVRMSDHTRTVGLGDAGRSIRGAIVHHQAVQPADIDS